MSYSFLAITRLRWGLWLTWIALKLRKNAAMILSKIREQILDASVAMMTLFMNMNGRNDHNMSTTTKDDKLYRYTGMYTRLLN